MADRKAVGFDLYRRLGSKATNVVLSPVSIAQAFTMAWSGARGETADEMARVLNLSGTREQVLATASRTVEALNQPGQFELRMANRLFAAATGTLEAEFVATSERIFRAGCESVDFARDPEAARAHVNAWVAQCTNNRIREVLPSGSIAGDAGLVLANAIYFLAKWAEPFVSSGTRQGEFLVRGGSRRTLKMCGTKHAARFSLRPHLRALELPYLGGRASMLILVPHDPRCFEQLERDLSSALLGPVSTLSGRSAA